MAMNDSVSWSADLGGDVYAALESRSNIDSIKETLRRFTLSL